MKLWFTGFFMAWGMFLAIPCPLRIWDERARRHMTRCLPLVGGLVGGLWALAAFLLRSAPAPILALVLTLLPWLCTGFLHLDGYMDVSDAVLSRRDLATRQKILKDSHCGAFAVISMVLLALTQWSVFLSAAELPLFPLAMVPVAVRACAACAVLALRPMHTSQYAAMEHTGPGICIVPAAVLLLACGLSIGFCGLAGLAPLVAAAVYALAVFYGFRQLDGMSGDISGFALTLGELAGAAAAVFLR